MTGILVRAVGGRPQLLHLDHTTELLKCPCSAAASVPRVDGSSLDDSASLVTHCHSTRFSWFFHGRKLCRGVMPGGKYHRGNLECPPGPGARTCPTSRTQSAPHLPKSFPAPSLRYPLAFGCSIPHSSASIFCFCCSLCLACSSPRQELHGLLPSGFHSKLSNQNLPSFLP